jgi:SOS response regulatory protein OraA/RecX
VAGTSARETALRALRHRDLSVAELERRLEERGFAASEREETIGALRRTGLLDDRRFAESRASVLAERGAGDGLVRHELERAGIESELVDEAVSLLEPEADRARRVVDRRGPGPRTARYLSGKGFGEETVAAVAVDAAGNALPGEVTAS